MLKKVEPLSQDSALASRAEKKYVYDVVLKLIDYLEINYCLFSLLRLLKMKTALKPLC